MADTRNCFALIAALRTHESSGRRIQHFVVFAFFHFFENKRIYSRCAASGSACPLIAMLIRIIHQTTAIEIISAQRASVFHHQSPQNIGTEFSEIAGHNQIIIARQSICISKKCFDCVERGRSHGCSHVIKIVQTVIDYFSECCFCYNYIRLML